MTDNLPVSPRVAGSSAISYRFGGREYPMKTVRNCRTCNSPFRFDIEEMIIQGSTYRRIAENVEAYGEEYAVSTRSMQDHFLHGHMPMELSDTRHIIEDRARRVGKAIDTGTEQLVDGISLMETVVMKTFSEIAKGTIRPGVRDGLRAAKLLADFGVYDGSNVNQQAFVEAFMVYHEEAERMMDAEAFDAFGRALDDNPILKALAAQYEGEDIVDAELVGEGSEEVSESSGGDS